MIDHTGLEVSAPAKCCHFYYLAFVPAAACKQYRISQKIEFEAEKARLERDGVKVGVALASEAGHDTRMLIIEGKKPGTALCEIKVRDGVVFEVK